MNDTTRELVKVSVVVLTYNRKRQLGDCLRSLIGQSYPAEFLEIVVSDDGSSDGTQTLVEQLAAEYPQIKYCPQPHGGIAAARNNGVINATGEIIAIVADDYILDRTYVTALVEFLQEYPDAQIVRFKVVPSHNNLGSRISHFYYDASVRRRLSPAAEFVPRNWKGTLAGFWCKVPPFEEKITTEHSLEAAGAAAFRREVFAQVGLFDESLQRAEDTDMTKRVRQLGISVYYNPHHHIRHQYHPLAIDTLYKCFLTGFNRYKLYRKHENKGDKHSLAAVLLISKIRIFLDAVWRARQAESSPKVLFYLPFMLLFELANKLGFFCGFVAGIFRSETKPPLRTR